MQHIMHSRQSAHTFQMVALFWNPNGKDLPLKAPQSGIRAAIFKAIQS